MYSNMNNGLSRLSQLFIPIVIAVLLLPAICFSQSSIVIPAREVRVSSHAHPHVHANEWEESLNVKEEEQINKSFTFAAGSEPRTLTIDNVWGSVHVTGGSGDQVEILAKKTIRAESKEELERAKKEVSLDIMQQPSLLKFYVNGPFRCQCNCDCNSGCNGNREHLGYVVKYDFEVRTPRLVNLTVRTVNDGDVKVEEIAGKYSVQNVNGPVQMTNVAGSGSAKTVNGDLKVLFRDNPQTDSSFATLNGDVDLYFLQKLSADLRFKTFNGEVFSDFQMSALPPRQPQEQRQGGKFVFRADRYAGGRVAAGGPEIKIETLNGDIHIRERHD